MKNPSPRITRRALLALALACPLALAGCADSDGPAAEAPVRIGTLATEDILPMWAALDEGLFEKAGIQAQVVTFLSATELIAAVSAGEVDLAMTDPMVTASLYASGADVSVAWVTLGTDASQGRFGIMTADANVTGLADLAGQEIGVGSNTILEYVMDTLMERAGVPAAQVIKAELQKLPVRYEAMASGQVKAAALPGSLLALGQASGCFLVADDTQGQNLSQSVMIVRKGWLDAAGAKALDALADVWDEAVRRINAAPETYRGLLVEKASLAPAVAQSYPVSAYPLATLPEQRMIDAVLVWMKSKGYLKESVAYNAADGTFSGR